jgi:H/ACA ribonucleoprotein complex non-core subunit NAF1
VSVNSLCKIYSTNGMNRKSAILSSSSDDASDSNSSSSESSSSTLSFRLRKSKSKPVTSSALHINCDEDEPATATYLATTHELPPTAIPVPSLPDPSTLPQEALELAGEIVTVLQDSVTVRGSGLLNATARERRDAVLDEGSLLLLDDHTPLGFVWETFGPTTLPHYLIRIKRRDPAQSTHQASMNDPPEIIHDSSLSEIERKSQPMPSSTPPVTSLSCDSPDPIKLFVSRTVYHIPSLSKYVFPGALARIKGSDASNIHDEEPDDHELEFSDDEAEAMYKRLRYVLSVQYSIYPR